MPFLGPAPGVEPRPLEVMDALEVRHIVGRQQADGGYQELTPRLVAVLHRQFPGTVGVLVVHAGLHPGVEADVSAQVELVGHVVQVALILGLPGIQLLPVPFLEQFLGEGVAIGVALGVEPRAWIAVPVPCAAHAGSVLKGLAREAQLPETVQRIQAGNARPDNQDFIFLDVPVPGSLCHWSLLQGISHENSLPKLFI